MATHNLDYMEDIGLERYQKASSLLSGIDDPQNYFCSVLGYMRSHRQMYVKAKKTSSSTNKTLYLGFESVWYFEGPMSWQGLDFRLGSLDERKDLLRGNWLNTGDLLDEFAKQHLLLVIERLGFRVRIFAGSLYIGETAPRISISYPGES